jgi:hypothetical protein
LLRKLKIAAFISGGFKNKAPHGHAEHNTQQTEIYYHSSTTMAEKRQGHPHHREQTGHHAYVYKNLPKKGKENPHA